MIIDHSLISPEALNGLIENFITQEISGESALDFDLTQEVCRVQDQIKSGKIVVTFDPESESFNLLTKENAELLEQSVST